MSSILSCWMKDSKRCRGSGLVKPSAIIAVVGTQSTLICPRCTSWRSQWRWISTWRRRVLSLKPFLTRRRMVCKLSDCRGELSSKSREISLNTRFHYIISLAALERASSSASVEDVVTVFCLLARQSIAPPKSMMI